MLFYVQSKITRFARSKGKIERKAKHQANPISQNNRMAQKKGNASQLIDSMVAIARERKLEALTIKEKAMMLILKNKLIVLKQKIDRQLEGYRCDDFERGIEDIRTLVKEIGKHL